MEKVKQLLVGLNYKEVTDIREAVAKVQFFNIVQKGGRGLEFLNCPVKSGQI